MTYFATANVQVLTLCPAVLRCVLLLLQGREWQDV